MTTTTTTTKRPTKRERERQEAVSELRAYLAPYVKALDKPDHYGDTHQGPEVFLRLDSVSCSGMSRRITPMLLVPNGEGGVSPRYLGRLMGLALGWPTKDHSIRVDGCGMDMGFHLVSTVSRVLYHDVCPRSDYVLRSRWL